MSTLRVAFLKAPSIRELARFLLRIDILYNEIHVLKEYVLDKCFLEEVALESDILDMLEGSLSYVIHEHRLHIEDIELVPHGRICFKGSKEIEKILHAILMLYFYNNKSNVVYKMYCQQKETPREVRLITLRRCINNQLRLSKKLFGEMLIGKEWIKEIALCTDRLFLAIHKNNIEILKD